MGLPTVSSPSPTQRPLVMVISPVSSPPPPPPSSFYEYMNIFNGHLSRGRAAVFRARRRSSRIRDYGYSESKFTPKTSRAVEIAFFYVIFASSDANALSTETSPRRSFRLPVQLEYASKVSEMPRRSPSALVVF